MGSPAKQFRSAGPMKQMIKGKVERCLQKVKAVLQQCRELVANQSLKYVLLSAIRVGVQTRLQAKIQIRIFAQSREKMSLTRWKALTGQNILNVVQSVYHKDERSKVIGICGALFEDEDADSPPSNDLVLCVEEYGTYGKSKSLLQTSESLTPEVPDKFVCSITRDIMKDPVITPLGHVFEKAALENWLRTNPTDPLSRTPLFKEQIYPLQFLKEEISVWRSRQIRKIERRPLNQ